MLVFMKNMLKSCDYFLYGRFLLFQFGRLSGFSKFPSKIVLYHRLQEYGNLCFGEKNRLPSGIPYRVCLSCLKLYTLV